MNVVNKEKGENPPSTTRTVLTLSLRQSLQYNGSTTISLILLYCLFGWFFSMKKCFLERHHFFYNYLKLRKKIDVCFQLF